MRQWNKKDGAAAAVPAAAAAARAAEKKKEEEEEEEEEEEAPLPAPAADDAAAAAANDGDDAAAAIDGGGGYDEVSNSGRNPTCGNVHLAPGSNRRQGGVPLQDTESDPAQKPGGGFLKLDVSSLAFKLAAAQAMRPPTYELTPDSRGMVPYRNDAPLWLRTIPGRNCLLEGMTSATAMGLGSLKVNSKRVDDFLAAIKRNPDADPKMGHLDQILRDDCSPFRLPLVDEINRDLKWTSIMQRNEGIYIVLCLVLEPDGSRDAHFIVIDRWRDLVIIGARWGAFRIEPDDKRDEARCSEYFLENFRLKTPMQVCKLIVAANRAHETQFNTPEHYTVLAQKRAKKLKRKMPDTA